MTGVTIGVRVHGVPEGLGGTIEALRCSTAGVFDLVLLPDGADEAGVALFGSSCGLPCLAGPNGGGGAAGFNRLAQFNGSRLIVLLESGARVGPGWLDRLEGALDADPRNGLAGPSTNWCWNEQAVFPGASAATAEIATAALQMFRRYSNTWKTLEPLHSLADFCYAVRREVVDSIGLADEGYGDGPCWEMDYNIRAARAGWRGVWACGAYVWRAPPHPGRRRDEARLFEVSKRRYQDRFCGARLRGEKSDYRAHCRGDACPNFALAALMPIRMRAPGTAPEAGVKEPLEGNGAKPILPSPVAATPPDLAPRPVPRVSCIMPTCDRLGFALAAIESFRRQTFEDAELIIVDDGTERIRPLLPVDPRIRCIELPSRLNVGAKRNLACAEARGELIVHWDDDDWYPDDRLRRQVEAFADAGIEVCGTSTLHYYDAAAARAWRYAYGTNARPWVAGNTLAYRRAWWRSHRFPEIAVGEDSRFVWGVPPRAVRDLGDPGLCVARIHGLNTSPKRTQGPWWHPCEVATLQGLIGIGWDAFARLNARDRFRDPCPLISCIMPTANRRTFLPLALELFGRQDYPTRELVVVDDGSDPVGDLVQGRTGVRYFRLAGRTSIGAKRNYAVERSQGEIIAHWDDDDWYSAERLRLQSGPLLANQADITGLDTAFTLELATGEFWKIDRELHRRLFVGDVHGGTLMFRRRLFGNGLRYPEVNLAEDACFLRSALRRGGRLQRLENPGLFVYVRHGRNAWRQYAPGRFLRPDGWQLTGPPGGWTDSLTERYCQAGAGVGPGG